MQDNEIQSACAPNQEFQDQEFYLKYPDWPGWPGGRTAVIAEVGINHGGDPLLAREMIDAAHENGADFVKLQSFVMENFFHPSVPYYADVEKVELGIEDTRGLFEHAAKKGIRLITTPFDMASLDMADKFGPPAHKVASMDCDNVGLLRQVAGKNRPMIISTGMADEREIALAVKTCRDAGNERVVLLHCVSDYPTPPDKVNAAMVPYLAEKFGVFSGLSDHSAGIDSSFIAASLGAAVIEKHFTISRTLAEKYPGTDNAISIEPVELARLADFCKSVPVMTGESPRKLTENETGGRQKFRRGLYAGADIPAGGKISAGMITALRPVAGLPASALDDVVGKKAARNIASMEPILPEDLV